MQKYFIYSIERKKGEKKILNISHSLFLREEIIVYNSLIFKAHAIPSIFQPVQKTKIKKRKNEFLFNEF